MLDSKDLSKELNGNRMHFDRGNAYFDTYCIFTLKSHMIGIIEDHCRGVKEQYFIGWKLKETITDGNVICKTKMFNTAKEAVNYSLEGITQ